MRCFRPRTDPQVYRALNATPIRQAALTPRSPVSALAEASRLAVAEHQGSVTRALRLTSERGGVRALPLPLIAAARTTMPPSTAPAAAPPQNTEHFVTDAQQMNARRRKEINEKHGDLIEALTTHSPGTAWYVVGIVALQVAITAAMSRFDASWWIIVPVSWCVRQAAPFEMEVD